jgi:hypothetical protein
MPVAVAAAVILMGYQLEVLAAAVQALEVRLLLRLQEAPLIQAVVEVAGQLMWAVRAVLASLSSAIQPFTAPHEPRQVPHQSILLVATGYTDSPVLARLHSEVRYGALREIR